MARSSAPCCDIRFLVLHTYPDGIKAYGHERLTIPIGRRGKPVKKLRLIPAERAHALARKLQGPVRHHGVGALRAIVLAVAGRCISLPVVWAYQPELAWIPSWRQRGFTPGVIPA